jgi:hypothetical protein
MEEIPNAGRQSHGSISPLSARWKCCSLTPEDVSNYIIVVTSGMEKHHYLFPEGQS